MQIWYCDDGYIYGSVESVLDAWRKIKEFGPNIGYWPNSKSTIYDLEVSNKFLWEKEGLTYSENGLTVLGSPVGNKKFIDSFCYAKLQKIVQMIEQLISITSCNPQAAFCVFNKAKKIKLNYLFRTTPIDRTVAQIYDEVLEKFLSAILGKDLNEKIIEQASFPIGRSGLGINVYSTEYCDQLFNNCRALSYYACRYISHDEIIDSEALKTLINQIKVDKKVLGQANR